MALFFSRVSQLPNYRQLLYIHTITHIIPIFCDKVTCGPQKVLKSLMTGFPFPESSIRHLVPERQSNVSVRPAGDISEIKVCKRSRVAELPNKAQDGFS
mgnify:CR=1